MLMKIHSWARWPVAIAGYLLALLGCAGAASAATYYVSFSAGQDASSGTQSRPWQTITRVNRAIPAPGDTVFFLGGDTWHGAVLKPISGVTYSTYGHGRASIDAAGQNDGILLADVSHVRINNFSISGAKRFGLEVSSDKGASRDITVSNTWTRNCGDCGMAFQTSTPSGVGLTEIKVTHCASHGNGKHGFYWGGGHYGAVTSVQCDHCASWDNGQVGFYCFGCDQVKLARDVALGNGTQDTQSSGFMMMSNHCTLTYCESAFNQTSGGDGGGFLFDTGSENGLIDHCYSHENYGYGYALTGGVALGANWHDNVVQRSVSHDDVLRVKGYGAVQFYAAPSTTPVSSGAVINCTVYLDKNGSHLPGKERYGLAAINNNEANCKVQGTRFVTLDGVWDALAYQPTAIKLDLNTWWSGTPDRWSAFWNASGKDCTRFENLAEFEGATRQEATSHVGNPHFHPGFQRRSAPPKLIS